MVKEVYKDSFSDKYIMRRKGAISLSINTLVVIIISLVILSGGITLLYKFIHGAKDIKGELDKKTQDELERLLVQQGQRVALPLHVADVNRGDTHIFGIGILNTYDTQQTFFIKISLSKAVDEFEKEMQVDKKSVDSWVFYNSDGILINPDNNHKEALLVSVPKNAAKGQYIFVASVQTSTGSYGNPQTFIVNVI